MGLEPGFDPEGYLMRAWLIAILVAMVSPAWAADIRVVAAGSLKDPFTAIFADFSKQYGVGFFPTFGPSGLLRERLQGGESFDVFASAALPHAQALTDGGLSGPSVMFGRNMLCVLTKAARPYETGNLVETLLGRRSGLGPRRPGPTLPGTTSGSCFTRSTLRSPATSRPCRKRRSNWSVAQTTRRL
jgi:molybdate transport system substrate-binding protein